MQVSAPFGFMPAYHPTGCIRAQGFKLAIPSGFASNIFKGQPVLINGANGNIEPVTANSVDFLGVLAGVQYADPNGRPILAPNWVAGATYPAGTEVIVWVWTDEKIVFEAQADGSVARTALGRQVNITNFTAGSALTGQSQATVGATPIAAGSQGQWYIVDVSRRPENDWADPFTMLQLTIARSQHLANKVGI